MARRLSGKQNVDLGNSKFPYGRIRDDDGTRTFGTPVNEELYGDMQQFFMKMMDYVIDRATDGFDFNNVPEDDYDGYQFHQALLRTKPYKYYVALITQTSTNAPIVSVLENNIGPIVWTRAGVGGYYGTLSSAFTSGRTFVLCNPNGITQGSNGTSVHIQRSTSSIVQIDTFNTSNVLADGILAEQSIEIRVY